MKRLFRTIAADYFSPIRSLPREFRFFLASILYTPVMLADLFGPNTSGIDGDIERALGL